MDKEVVALTYNETLFSHKQNESEPVLVRWMNLEPVIHSEVSQKEKNKYGISMHIYGIYKNGIDKPIAGKV